MSDVSGDVVERGQIRGGTEKTKNRRRPRACRAGRNFVVRRTLRVHLRQREAQKQRRGRGGWKVLSMAPGGKVFHHLSLIVLFFPTPLEAKIVQFGLLHPLEGDEGPVLLFPLTEEFDTGAAPDNGSLLLPPRVAVERYVHELERIGPKCWGSLPVSNLNISTFHSHRAFQRITAEERIENEAPGESLGSGDSDDNDLLESSLRHSRRNLCGVRMLVIANRIGHMCPATVDPFPHVRQKLVQAGAEAVHILPIRMDLILNSKELDQLMSFILTYYDGLVAIGGADIHPVLLADSSDSSSSVVYHHQRQQQKEIEEKQIEHMETEEGEEGEKKEEEVQGQGFGAAHYKEIDLFELSLLEAWLNAGRGTVFGICRGHQLLSVLHGAVLTQDIATELPQHPIRHTAATTTEITVAPYDDPFAIVKPGDDGVQGDADMAGRRKPLVDQETAGSSSWHVIRLLGRENALFRAVNKDEFLVNSRHHQAVMFPYGPLQARFRERVKIIAVAGDDDEVVEAIELRNGAGFGVQFHPEDMDNGDGDAVMRMMVNMTKMKQAQREQNSSRMTCGLFE
eukprot:jgi/Bigna1/88085/estExt_fgenesh1_pg.C_280017